MSYSIDYSSGTTRKYPKSRKKSHQHYKKILGILCVLAVVIVLFNIKTVRRLLLPGDPAVTEKAIVSMVNEFRAGEGVQEAFAVFCREVIEGAVAE